VAKTHRHSAIQTTQQTQDAALRPEWTGRRVFLPVSSEHSGSDGRGYRSDGRLSRPGTAIRPNATERLADVPPGDGDSDRDVAQPRSGRLSSRSTDDSVVTSPTQADGPGPGSSRGPNGTHSCCCLRRRPCRQPTYPGSRSRPASQRSTMRPPGNSPWNRSSQQPAAAALTMRSLPSPRTI